MLALSNHSTLPYFYNQSMDSYGTINPAALNAPDADFTSYATQTTPRGSKRSRSPDFYGQQAPYSEVGDEDDSKPRKRGRPPKVRGSPPAAAFPLTPATPNSSQPNNAKSHMTSQMSPTQGSPEHATPATGGKAPLVKALPTVRDHTTDQLNPEKDEYIAREHDDAGEKKVDANGNLTDREYRLRTFTVPHRGEKLFMLATECARVLGYRDSYLLFNKNRSLFKIIANQEEKDNLIAQDVLPYSYRSRQIAIVTARSMFRQFGSRVIIGGRRVRDDYWEAKARKQGFTEDDPAGEKRPGATKQREAAIAEAHANTMASLPHGQVVYSSAVGLQQPPVPPGIDPLTLAAIPMHNELSPESLHSQSFNHITRPKYDPTESRYEDFTRESNPAEVAGQAGSSAEFNKQLTASRSIRSQYLDDYWKRPHEAPPSPAQSAGEVGGASANNQHMQSPQHNGMGLPQPQQGLNHLPSAHLMQQQHGYGQQHQASMLGQSPVRGMPQGLPQMQQGAPGMGMNQMGGRPNPSYNYNAGGMWPPPQPSPHQMQAYGQQHHAQQQQHQMQPPGPRPGLAGAMGFNQMNPGAYGNVNRNMYQGSPGQPQQFGQQQQQQQQQMQPGMQWGQPQGGMGQDWQRGYQ